MQKYILLLFCFVLFVTNIFTVMPQAAPRMILKDLIKAPSMLEIIKNDLQDAKYSLITLKDLLVNVKTYFKSSSYLNATKLAITKEGEGGVYFEFGYKGHGDLLKPFLGFQTKLDLTKLPNWVDVAFINTLSAMGFDSIVNITPQNEFLIKLILLLSDANKKILTPKAALTELIFLFYRLALLKEVDSFKSFFDPENKLVYQIIESVKVNDKKLDVILDDYWEVFKDIVNYDFEVEKSNPAVWVLDDLIDSNNWNEILKIAAAIGLKTAVEYYVAKEKFIQTSNGRVLNDKILNAQNSKECLNTRKKFLEALPEYQDLLSKTQLRVRRFLIRIKGIRSYWNEFVEKIRLILAPFFDSLGLSFDLIVGKMDDL